MLTDEYSYSGSRILQPVSDIVGLPVDQINLISAEVFALLFAFVFRWYFHHSRVTKRTRNLVSFITGVILCVFCIGHEVKHLFLQALVAYALMRVLPPQSLHITVCIWSMSYLSIRHLHRLLYDYGAYVLDATGPMMVITQKLCSLAFSYHDGRYRRDEDLTEDQRQQCVREVPTILEYLSYIFCFQGVLCGPLLFYKDYDNFITGANFKTNANSKGITEPSPNIVILKKLAFCGVSVFVTLIIMPHLPVLLVIDADFIANHNIVTRIAYLHISLFCIRFKYYFAWMLSESVCHASGLGFNGYDEKGVAKWDLVDNVNVYSIETATSIKTYIGSWNIQTNAWLRRVCYNRVTILRVPLTNLLSAAWHGFYPGYYFTFLDMSLFVMAGRKVRRLVRPHFLLSPKRKLFYDIFTLIGSHITMAYIMLPFVLLQLTSILTFYNGLYWWMHIVVIIIFIVPSGSMVTAQHKPVPDSANHNNLKSN